MQSKIERSIENYIIYDKQTPLNIEFVRVYEMRIECSTVKEFVWTRSMNLEYWYCCEW